LDHHPGPEGKASDPAESTAGKKRRSPWRSVLLSGLVLPGLGQLLTGHPVRGLAFAGATVAALVVLVRKVARETLARLPEDPTTIDPLLPFRLAHEIHTENAAFFFWLTVALVVVWAGSMLDAWHSSRPGRQG
jgi:hypothetical protein